MSRKQKDAAVAQSVVRRIGSAEVTGPIPVSSSARNRVADETYVGEHQRKTYHALVIMIARDETRHPETEYQIGRASCRERV